MRYLTLAEALAVAEAVTGIDADVLARVDFVYEQVAAVRNDFIIGFLFRLSG